MASTTFTWNQIKAGFTGALRPNAVSSPTYMTFRNNMSCWAGWVTGTQLQVYTGGNAYYWAIVDGAWVLANTVIGVSPITIFTGLSDVAHFVQIFSSNKGFIGGPFNTSANFMIVTGSNPTVENFGDNADVRVLVDPAFPGFHSYTIPYLDWGDAWKANSTLSWNNVITKGGTWYTCNVPYGQLFTGDTGPTGTGSGIGENQGTAIWTSTAALPTYTMFSGSNPSPTASNIAWSQGTATYWETPGSGGHVEINGKGKELWVMIDTTSAVGGINWVNHIDYVNATVGVAYNKNITAGIGATLGSCTATGLPPGISLATNGALSGTPTTAGTYIATITSTRSGISYSIPMRFEVLPGGAGFPIIAGSVGHNFNVGDVVSIPIVSSTITPTYPTVLPTSWSASGLPPGLSLTGNVISGAPTTAGDYNITVTATNPSGTASRNIAIAIATAGAPVFDSYFNHAAGSSVLIASIWSAAVAGWTYQIKASNSPTSFGAIGLPFGLSVNPTTGLISGTPTQFGTFIVTLSATNSFGTTTAKLMLTTVSVISASGVVGGAGNQPASSYSWSIDNGPINDINIVLGNGSLPKSHDGTSTTQNVTNVGAVAGPGVWYCVSSNLDTTTSHKYQIFNAGSGLTAVALRSPSGAPVVYNPVNKNRTKMLIVLDSTEAAICGPQKGRDFHANNFGVHAIDCSVAGTMPLQWNNRIIRSLKQLNVTPDVILSGVTTNDPCTLLNPWISGGSVNTTTLYYSSNGLGYQLDSGNTGATGTIAPSGIDLRVGSISDGVSTWHTYGSFLVTMPWKTGSPNYPYGTFVVQNGIMYQCDGIPSTLADGYVWAFSWGYPPNTQTIAWASGATYTAGQWVTSGGKGYICLVAGGGATSVAPSYSGTAGLSSEGPNLASGAGTAGPTSGLIGSIIESTGLRWHAMSSTTMWAASTPYVVGNIVLTTSGELYQCIASGTSGSIGPVGTSTCASLTYSRLIDGTVGWVCITRTPIYYSGSAVNGQAAGPFGNSPRPWLLGVAYDKFEVVMSGDRCYVCDTTGIAGTIAPTGSNTTIGSISDGNLTWHYTGLLPQDREYIAISNMASKCGKVLLRYFAVGNEGAGTPSNATDGLFLAVNNASLAGIHNIHYVPYSMDKSPTLPRWGAWREAVGAHLTSEGYGQLAQLVYRDGAWWVNGNSPGSFFV